MTKAPSPATELRTVRDLLRYGVSQFNAARLTYGHGTSTARSSSRLALMGSPARARSSY